MYFLQNIFLGILEYFFYKFLPTAREKYFSVMKHLIFKFYIITYIYFRQYKISSKSQGKNAFLFLFWNQKFVEKT